MSSTTNGKDPRITAATAHWSHRFISNGVPLADFQDVTGQLVSWDDWCAAWCEKAEVHQELGRQALAEGFHLSAGEHLSVAAVCFHFAKFLFVQDREAMRAAHARAVACRQQALPLVDPPGERLEIDFQGHTLSAILRRPMGVPCPPIVLMAMGLDSAKEEMPSNEAVFLARGMATLAFDGPGQGEAEYALPIHPAYEEPVSAVIDHLQQRCDIDTARLGIWGVSLGGYYAARAAAFETRIRACVSLTGPFDFAEAFASAPKLTQAAFIARSFSASETDAMRVAHAMNLSDCAGRIQCPTYIVGGALDRVIPPEHAQRLAEAVSGPVVLNMVADGSHVANNRPYKYRTQAADWMSRQLDRT